jgi:hypothetical protein
LLKSIPFLIPTEKKMNDTFAPNIDEYEAIKSIANSSNDGPVLMININKYLPNAGYPDGELYKDYMKALYLLLEQLGARILWHVPVQGQPVGVQPADEILGAWYPSHKSFLALREQPGSDESFRCRDLCVDHGVVHRCPENIIPK